MQVATLKLKTNTNEMEGHNKHKTQMTTLVKEIDRMNEENQKLNTMLKRMRSSYKDLQKHIKSLPEQKKQLMLLDQSEIFNPDDQSEENFNLEILSEGSVHTDTSTSSAVSHKSDHSSDCHERDREKEGKKAKFMDDQQLPSKKRKIHSIQLDQTQNDMIINSCMDDSLICDKSPNKKHKSLSKGSSEQTTAASKRIVSVRTRSEGSRISDGCQWRKYGQKMTRNNTQPRSYFKCAMVPSCPVKKQVQRCAEDPTIVVTTYEGEHTHSLSPLAMAVMHTGLYNQLIGEGPNRENCLPLNDFTPFSTARISTSSPFPTITLDLADNQPNPGLQVKQPNPGLQLQPSHLAVGRFQHLTPLPNNMGHAFDQYSSIEDSVASLKADPNFTAALAVAIADSMLKSGPPVQGMPRLRRNIPMVQLCNHVCSLM